MAEVPARRDVVAAVRFLERHPCVCNLRIGLRQYPRCFAGVVRRRRLCMAAVHVAAFPARSGAAMQR